MAFTHDELKSLNAIMEQKLADQRQELELAFEQRVQALNDELDQRMASSQQQTTQFFVQAMQEQRIFLQDMLQQCLSQQHTLVIQKVMQEVELHQQNNEENVAHSLAAQLLAIEQLITQRLGHVGASDVMSYNSFPLATPDFDAIEVQTEIPWDDLVEMIDRRLDERFANLRYSLVSAIKDVERHLVIQMNSIRDALKQERNASLTGINGGKLDNMQDVFRSLEQLEHLIEAMQVSMTANNALLSNRLYHHQQLPLERAHPTRPTHAMPAIQEISPISKKESDDADYTQREQISRHP